MAKPGTAQLRKTAIATLHALGYQRTLGRLNGYYGRSVERMIKNGIESWYLIQCRHHQSDTHRYLIGILVDALQKVDQVVLFFEGEPKIVIIPAEFLRGILRRRIEAGNARYTGPHNEQWRVNVHLYYERLSSQGSGGTWHDISRFVKKMSGELVA
jgi:hypothetical protein